MTFGRRGTLVVVSHACVAEANQSVYGELQDLGWDVHLVVPSQWEDDYRPAGYRPTIDARLEKRARLVPVAGRGREQRFVYRCRVGRILDEIRPDIVFLEQEPFAMSTAQWIGALRRRRIPFGLQHAENLDRRMPFIARAIRKISTRRAAFVWARSPAASELIRSFKADLLSPVVPHAVPGWAVPAERQRRESDGPMTIGYAGRFVAEKGVSDIVAATDQLDGARLLFVGAGPLADELRGSDRPDRRVELRAGVRHEAMDAVFAEMDVLVLPSHTTTQWAEQFGRVLVEALWCGCPVVGSSSGEIPWVVRTTGGGWTFAEGDTEDLTRVLRHVRDHPAEAASRARAGRTVVGQCFGVEAVARQADGALQDVLSAHRSQDGPNSGSRS